jgi:uncharacterized protein
MRAATLMNALPDQETLIELLSYRMPFGKYEGTRLLDLPETYLAWFVRQGMPKGKLGMLMETALVVRSNGLESMCRELGRALEVSEPQ